MTTIQAGITDEKICSDFISNYLKECNPHAVKKCTYDTVYQNSERNIPEEVKKVYEAYYSNNSCNYSSPLPRDWNTHSGSVRSINLEHPSHPGYLFKFCTAHPGRANPAAHILRVEKGREAASYVEKKNLTELEIVQEVLLPLKTQAEVEKLDEKDQCYHFAVKSKKLKLLDCDQTIDKILSFSEERQRRIAHQIMQLVCYTGLGDVSFQNILYNTETEKLAFIDLEPIFMSLSLDGKQIQEETKKIQEFKDKLKNGASKETADEYSEFLDTCLYERTIKLQAIEGALSKCALNGVSSLKQSLMQKLPTFTKIIELYDEKLRSLHNNK